MRVLVLASGDLWAGAEAVVYQLIHGLKKTDGMDVFSVFFNDGRLAELTRETGVRTVVIDESRKNFLSIMMEFIRIIREYRPDIIHSHRNKENVLAAFARPASMKSRLVTTLHGLSEGNTRLKSRIVHGLNLAVMATCFHKLVAVSQDIADHLRKTSLVPENKIVQIYNGIQLPGNRMEKDHREDSITIGSAGRLFPVKDYPLMVRIAREVCSVRVNTRFLLAGDGPEMKMLQNMVRDSNLEDRFIFLGNVIDMEGFYDTLDMYINTSVHEGIPMTVLEAMAHAKPVIAPAVGGFNEIITQGEDGYLIPSRSAEDFTRQVVTLIDQREKRLRMGRKARNKVEGMFTAEHMVNQYVRLYREVLAA